MMRPGFTYDSSCAVVHPSAVLKPSKKQLMACQLQCSWLDVWCELILWDGCIYSAHKMFVVLSLEVKWLFSKCTSQQLWDSAILITCTTVISTDCLQLPLLYWLSTSTTILLIACNYHYCTDCLQLPLFYWLPATTTIVLIVCKYHYSTDCLQLPLLYWLSTVASTTNMVHYCTDCLQVPLFYWLPATTTVLLIACNYHYSTDCLGTSLLIA
jgi:hypothetical protein